MRKGMLLAVVLYLVTLVQSAGGATYFVRKSGNDSNSGSAASQAWLTLSRASNTVSAGDIVYIGGGTYNEQLHIQTAGTAGSPIRFVADESGAQTGDAGLIVVTQSGMPVLKIESSYVEVDGCIFSGGTFTGHVMNSTNVKLIDCEFYGSGDDGIRVDDASLELTGCYIHHTGDDGIDTDYNCTLTLTNTDVSDCTSEGIDGNEGTTVITVNQSRVHDNGGHGLELKYVTCHVINSLVYGNGLEGILTDDNGNSTLNVWHSTIAHNGDEGIDHRSGNATIVNSIIAFNSDDGIAKRSGTTMSHSYNLVYGNGDLQYNGTSASTGEISGDPKFAEIGDYRLSPGSPAIDAGTDGSATTSIDMLGVSRPLASGWDIGAYEGVAVLQFTDVSSATGFNVQTVTDQNTAGSLHWGDLDNDGDLDAIVTGNSTARRLMNVGAGSSFSASTFGSGNVRRQGALVDLDNDGDLDFWSSSVGSFDTEKYYENDGNGTFVDRGNIGLSSPSNNEGLAANDVNADGWCDIIMFSGNGNWIGHHEGNVPVVLTGTNDVTFGLNNLTDTGNGVFCSSGDVNDDGYLDFFYHYNGGTLFLSQGDGTFTMNAGGISIETASGSSTQKAGSAWADYDNDGDLDLFAARYDSGESGYLWRNEGGVLTDVASGAGVENIWEANIRRRGFRFRNHDWRRFRHRRGGWPRGHRWRIDNAVSLNVTMSAGIADESGQRSGCWGDYDNDGDLDLYVVTRGNKPNALYQNQGFGRFKRVYEGVGAVGDGHDAVFVDYDNDGDLDLAVVQQGATNVLLRNDLNNDRYLKVRVVGGGEGQTNVAAVGVRVDLYAADGTTFLARREIGVARGYGGSAPMWLHFGGVDPNQSYVVWTHFVDGVVTTPVVPANVATVIGSTTIPQMLTVNESNPTLVLKSWGSKRRASQETRFRSRRQNVGWNAPLKDLNHLQQLGPQ